MRILCFDYGERYVGVSICDMTETIASPLCLIEKSGDNVFKPVMAKIKEIVKEYDVKLFVLGLPKNMDNTEGVRCEHTREFKNRLNKYFKSIDVVLVDERLTTNMANRLFTEANLSIKKKNDNVDMVASTIILQTYLDTQKNK